MIFMEQARIYVDLNERVDKDIFLLSKEDSKVDSKGNIVTLYENMPILIWSDDCDEEGNPDNLFADAVAIKADLRICSVWSYVKWWCRIDMSTLIHESERRARNRLYTV